MGQRANLWKQSFNGGELSPRLGARVDQIKYGAGATVMQNFLPTVQGPIIRRGGTQWVLPAFSYTKRGWLLKFNFNTVNSYVLEFSDNIIRFFTNRGFVSDVSVSCTAMTKAAQGVFSCVNAFVNGNMVQASGFAGALGARMNGRIFTINNVTGTTFQLLDVNGVIVNTTAFPAYTSGGTFSRAYQIVSPYAAADLTDSTGRLRLKFFQSQDVIYIAHPNYSLQILSRLSNTSWTIAPAAIKNGPFQTTNSNQSQTVYTTPTTSAVSGAASNGSGLIRLAVGSTAGIVTGNTIEIVGVTGTVEANGVWPVTVIDGTHVDLIASTFVNAYVSGGTIIGRDGTAINLTANATIFASVGADELFLIKNPISTSIPQWSPGLSVTLGNRYQVGLNTYLALNTATTGSDTPIHTQGAKPDGNPGVTWLYEDSGYGIIQLTSINANQKQATGIVQVSPPNANSSAAVQTFLWAHGQFGSVQGYPEVVTIFRDRLTLFRGIQAMGSVSDDYLNFSPLVGGQQTPDSGWVITMPISSSVMWATPLNDLLVGTRDVELYITEIDASQALGPTNIRTRLQTSHGSVLADAVGIEFANMFVNKSGQTLRQQIFNFYVSGYVATDVTLFSEHIPKGPDGKQGIVQLAWCQDPDYLLWSNTTDGRLICFTYHSEQQVTAWHNHPVGGRNTAAPLAAKGFTNAVVESVVAIPSPDGSCDDLWLQVQRTVNGQQVRYIEFLTQYFTDIPTNIANAFYVDAGLTYSGAAAQQFWGYDHLVGETLDVLVNGAPQNQITVAADGSITLQDLPVGSTMIVQAGEPAWARFTSMRPEGGTQQGTAQTLLKQISQIAVRLLATLGMKFGDPNNPKGEAGYEPIEFRSAGDPMDAPPPLFSGDKGKPGEDTMNITSATDTDGLVAILCDQPLPCQLIGMRATMEVTE